MILNILVGLIVIGLTVVIQGYGTVKWLARHYKRRSMLDEANKSQSARILISTSLFLLFLHLIQAGLWALVYVLLPGISEFENFEKSMYFSLVTFTTLGYGEITIGSANRILSGLEAINGITMIGWSTALMFAIFQELIKENFKAKRKD